MSISGYAVWEVRTTGSDANGGFYVSGGTDFSQQDAAQLTVTDCVTNGTTTVTSATGGFTSSMIGNGINVAGSVRQITAVGSTNSITVDALIASASGQTAKVGGAHATLTPSFANAVASHTIWLKLGNYAGAFSLSASGRVLLRGYGSARGDGLRPTISATANSQTILTMGAAGVSAFVKDIILDGGGFSSVIGMTFANTRNNAHRVRSQNMATPFSGASGCQYAECEAVNCTNGFPSGCHTHACYASVTGTAFNGPTSKCVAKGASIGFNLDNVYLTANCIAYGCTTGFSSANFMASYDCVAVNCTTGWAGGTSTTTNLAARCYGYNNTAQVSGTAFIVAPLTLSAAPFANPTATINSIDDVWTAFALNSTVGGGQTLKAAGYPGYSDIGAVQSQGTGGVPMVGGSPLIRVRGVA